MVRLYTVYNIHFPQIYTLVLWTFVVAVVHFACEWLVIGVWKYEGWRGIVPAMLVVAGFPPWMLVRWETYVGKWGCCGMWEWEMCLGLT